MVENKEEKDHDTEEQGEKCISCPHIESSLFFSPTTLGVCCIPHAGGRGLVQITEFRGGQLPVETILATRRELRQNLNHGGDSRCDGCMFLNNTIWPPKKYLVDTLLLGTIIGCNARCIYCNHPSYSSPAPSALGYNLLPVLQTMIEEKLLAPKPSVYWGGAETSLQDWIPAAVRILAEHGAEQLIHTNSITFVPGFLELLHAQQLFLMTSIDAGSRSLYKLMKGVDAFERVVANLARYSEQGRNKVILKAIIRDENATYQNVRDLIAVTQQCGIREFHVDVDHQNGAAPIWDPPGRNRIISCMALLLRELRRAGIMAQVAGAGVTAFPGQKIREEAESLAKNGQEEIIRLGPQKYSPFP